MPLASFRMLAAAAILSSFAGAYSPFPPEIGQIRELTSAASRRTAEKQQERQSSAVGVLVMAHGGAPDWNQTVEDAVKPLQAELPLEVAFGMADPATIQEAVTRLEAQGVGRIAVVRLFISGDSFKERTEKILGLRPGAPPRPPDDHGHHGGGHHHGGHGDPDSMPLWRVESKSKFLMSGEGLMDSSRMGSILAERAEALSRDPARESVLILGHGPGDEEENRRWLERIDHLAGSVRAALPFLDVRVDTLREDWPEARLPAEARIRRYVQEQTAKGAVIVIPFRLSGFGPYAEVLEDLSYVSDGKGLLPHPEVTEWIRDQVRRLAEKMV